MRSFNYNHLYYFWSVAREGSISRAAKVLHLTPQTISGQLGVLEHALGTPLFAPSGRTLVLTDAGRTAYSYAEEIFRLGSELGDVMAGRSQSTSLLFHVGIVDVVPKLLAYRLLQPALTLHVPVQLVCREGKLDDLLADLALHKLDMVLADTPVSPSVNVRAFNHLLGECGVTFLATPTLARRLSGAFPQCLDGAPLLLPALQTALRGAMLQWFNEIHVRPHVVGEFDDTALMQAFGEAGVGVFAVPSVVAQDVQTKYAVEVLGRTENIRERFYAISGERRLRHAGVVAVSQGARDLPFDQQPPPGTPSP